MHTLRWGLFLFGAALQALCLLRLFVFCLTPNPADTAKQDISAKQQATAAAKSAPPAKGKLSTRVWQASALASCLLIGTFALWEHDIVLLSGEAILACLFMAESMTFSKR